MATGNIQVEINVVIRHHAMVTDFQGQFISRFYFESGEELKAKLVEYGEGEFMVHVDGVDLGPAYAAAYNFEEKFSA
jgi:hypothetical protein